MSYITRITREGIVLADGAALASAENGAALVRLARDGADNAAPVLGGATDAQLFGELLIGAANSDVNAYKHATAAAPMASP